MRVKPTEPIERTCPEEDIFNELLSLDGKRILDLGCGNAKNTRILASGGKDRTVVALEVDEIQHEKNLQIKDLENVSFGLGGAEAIPADDASFDVVFMFKSLHHVPSQHLGQVMIELDRVLKAGGYAYISEPIFYGPFNDILRLFHNEQEVRNLAFETVKDSVEQGVFELVEEVFFNVPLDFENFQDFEEQVVNVSHTKHKLSPQVHKEVQGRFEKHMTNDGAHFRIPIRVDLLRKKSWVDGRVGASEDLWQ